MENKISPEEAFSSIESNIIGLFIQSQDYNDSETEKILDEILELFYEKHYREGMVKYLAWIPGNEWISKSEIRRLKIYAEHLGIDTKPIDSFVSYEEACEQGLIDDIN